MRQTFLGEQIERHRDAHAVRQATGAGAQLGEHAVVGLAQGGIGRHQIVGEPELAALQVPLHLQSDGRLHRHQHLDLLRGAESARGERGLD